MVVSTAALVGASSAAAEVTQEDREFAAAVRAFDAQTLTVTHDPAVLEAMRARRQAATACLDAAGNLGARRDGSAFVGEIFYTLHVIAPAFVALGPPTGRYVHALRALRLRNPVLRSARAAGRFARVAPDFCGPLRAWQDARFDTIPAPIADAVAAFRSAPAQDDERTTKLRRASVRLRAVGVRLAVRERFVGVRSALDLDPLFKGDQVDAALGAAVSGP